MESENWAARRAENKKGDRRGRVDGCMHQERGRRNVNTTTWSAQDSTGRGLPVSRCLIKLCCCWWRFPTRRLPAQIAIVTTSRRKALLRLFFPCPLFLAWWFPLAPHSAAAARSFLKPRQWSTRLRPRRPIVMSAYNVLKGIFKGEGKRYA